MHLGTAQTVPVARGQTLRLADEVVAEPVVAVQLLVEALALVGADRAGRYRLQVRVYIRQVGVADRVGPPS